MFRVAARKSVSQSIKSVRQQSSQPASPSPAVAPKKSGVGKALVGLTVAGAGGAIGYAYVDPEFRQKIETTIPQSKEVLDKILGETKKITIQPLPGKLSSLEEPKKVKDVLPPLEKVPLPPVSRPPINVDPVDVKKEVAPIVSPAVELEKNKQLEDKLKKAILSAEGKVRLATDAKLRTINAINEHASVLKKTVDDAKNAKWENVTSALQQAEAEAKKDSVHEVDGRNYIDLLLKVVNDGKNDPLTATNPLLLNAQETAIKLSHQLDEVNALVNKARQESSVLNQYKDLIEKSREQFALEMKSILPNVDINARGKNLTEEELNALIAHAHLKVDQLRRQLTEQQVREEAHIAQAIQEQKLADERIANEKLSIELNRVSKQKELEIERALVSSRSSWEEELENQLKRTSAAHSEHLEQVIRTQRQLFEIEHNQKVEEAVLRERDLHSKQVGLALSRLEGIEDVLGSRIALDNENRRAKQFWIACHNLIDYIKHGNKAGNTIDDRRLPLTESLKLLKEVNPEDEFVKTIIDAFPKQSTTEGTYTEQDLKNRFNKLYKVGRRTALIDDNGGGLGAYFWSYVKSILLIDLPKKYENDLVNISNIDNIEILALARHYVEINDLDKAVRVVQLLNGEPARLARDWVIDTRAYLESRLLAELLVAHAAVSSIRSTY
ncbi:unnamed protein product [Caenorhabditis bovis]|uniref:MICOS complex subunit MIC60 n=1 Tax=Caenorhabditis bovis TaxID=2654633 RepID=A0A8S1ELQ9_9PELO|nr:unnamed protein product [Caenorhabditis bovis]